MGKGDIRTRRGKIWRGTYGVTRPRRWKTVPVIKGTAKTRKVKALKDLPQAVSEPIMEMAVESVSPIRHDPFGQVIETQAPVPAVTQPAAVETAPVVRSSIVKAAVKVKSTVKRTVVKKASAAKKTKTDKKVVAKKPAVKKPSSKKKK